MSSTIALKEYWKLFDNPPQPASILKFHGRTVREDVDQSPFIAVNSNITLHRSLNWYKDKVPVNSGGLTFTFFNGIDTTQRYPFIYDDVTTISYGSFIARSSKLSIAVSGYGKIDGGSDGNDFYSDELRRIHFIIAFDFRYDENGYLIYDALMQGAQTTIRPRNVDYPIPSINTVARNAIIGKEYYLVLQFFPVCDDKAQIVINPASVTFLPM